MPSPDWFVTAQNNAVPAVVPTSAAPAGTLNGTNTVFTLSSANLLQLFLNGVLQNPGVDYTISGVTVTFTVAPKASDWMLAFYN